MASTTIYPSPDRHRQRKPGPSACYSNFARSASRSRSAALRSSFDGGLIVFLAISCSLAQPLTLWYRQPAKLWVEALPVGNGRLGAMIFGGTVHERIQFNEQTVWTGEPHD